MNLRERCDQAHLVLDINIDFRECWNWNVNHIYVSVLAEFETKARKRNEVVVWDRILSSKRDARIKLQEARNKYLLKDLGYNLRGTPVTLRVQYSILPHTGALKVYKPEAGHYNFTMPDKYIE
mmetsp:Transcript_7987/g.16056  ORF Transcript_7987/g.16056 Transcript_7987/m.16056 type:complete len:123 (+) Transcript_7987:330-698(+)